MTLGLASGGCGQLGHQPASSLLPAPSRLLLQQQTLPEQRQLMTTVEEEVAEARRRPCGSWSVRGQQQGLACARSRGVRGGVSVRCDAPSQTGRELARA
jgi:hypothetical protein